MERDLRGKPRKRPEAPKKRNLGVVVPVFPENTDTDRQGAANAQ